MEGLRSAVSAALDFGIVALERGEDTTLLIPSALFAQAREAARSGVSLDVVLRRYFGGYTLLTDFFMEEAERDGDFTTSALRQLQRSRAFHFDRLMAAVTEEYSREAAVGAESAEERRAERVKRILGGELLPDPDLGYDLDAIHVGLVATGTGIAEALLEIARALDRRLLITRRAEETIWAWLGGRREIERKAFDRGLATAPLEESIVAIGEPAHGVAGWRLTHRQAAAAFGVAVRDPAGVVRYADVALLASVLRDELLAGSLRQLYLAPLAEERDGGEVLRRTLRAYFDAERQASSAAVMLRVNRHTVTNRLRIVEERIGRSLGDCAAEFETALRLEELERPPLE